MVNVPAGFVVKVAFKRERVQFKQGQAGDG